MSSGSTQEQACTHWNPCQGNGRNVTGILVLAEHLDGKRFDLLRETVPGAKRFAVLALNPVRHAPHIAAMKAAAERGGLNLQVFYAEKAADYRAAFAAMRAEGAQALAVASSREFSQDAPLLAALAREAMLPTVCEWARMAAQGCLLGYGASFNEVLTRTGHYVAEILQGASAGDLPIEHPSRLEFAINLNTARTLGIAIPPAIIAQAEELIE